MQNLANDAKGQLLCQCEGVRVIYSNYESYCDTMTHRHEGSSPSSIPECRTRVAIYLEFISAYLYHFAQKSRIMCYHTTLVTYLSVQIKF